MLREINFDSKKVPAFIDGAINTMILYKKTGICDLFNACTVTAPIDYTTTGYGTITFNDGLIMIYGRGIYIEAGTELAIPITSTSAGSIGVKVDLNQNAGSQVVFYSKTTQTLTQQDLNENKTDGIYEFEIFKYTSNGTTLTLTYQSNSVLESNETILSGIFDGTYSVKNSENAILKQDGTYEGLTKDSSGILYAGDLIIPQIKTLWTGSTTSVDLRSYGLSDGDILEITTDVISIPIIKVVISSSPRTYFIPFINAGTIYATSLLESNNISVSTTSISVNGVYYNTYKTTSESPTTGATITLANQGTSSLNILKIDKIIQ